MGKVYMPEDHMDKLYNSRNPLVSFVHNKRIDSIVRLSPKGKCLKILDAGCGEGHLIRQLKKKSGKSRSYGIDITKIALKNARKKCPFAEIMKMNLSDIKYASNTFDVVVCTEFIEHIKNYKKVISELKRVTKKGAI